MDKSKALELLKQALDEIPKLRTLPPDRRQYELWREKVCNILELAFSRSSREYDNFSRAVRVDYLVYTEKEKREKYNKEMSGREFPTACETLARHFEECLTFYRFPERHWKHIRTSNVIERFFKEVKRRTRVVGRFPNETSALVMVFSILNEERLKWQKVRMRVDDIA